MTEKEVRCHDCGCREGELHEHGCDMESCSEDGGQLITCGCLYTVLGYPHDREAPFCGLPEEIYRNGLSEEQRAESRRLIDERGRVPFMVYPSICARCGKLWPAMGMVPDWEWERYVEPSEQLGILCQDCYDEIKGLIDERAGLPDPKMVTCPECEGSGVWSRPSGGDIECPVCRGRCEIAESQLKQWQGHKESMEEFMAYRRLNEKRTTLSGRLEQVDAQIKELEAKRRAIYKESIDAPEDEKVCGDAHAAILADDFLERMRLQYPIEVRAINWAHNPESFHRQGKTPRLVKVRPASDDKTYLGIYVGDLPLGVGASYHSDSGILSIAGVHTNPAMIVPELGRIVMGCESWWGDIKSEEELKDITDDDIQNVWYVQMMQKMIGDEKGTDDG